MSNIFSIIEANEKEVRIFMEYQVMSVRLYMDLAEHYETKDTEEIHNAFGTFLTRAKEMLS